MRLIDADALLVDGFTHVLPCSTGKAAGRIIIFAEDIENAPTVDAEPVRHGNWKLIEVDGEDCFGNITRIHLSSVCSVCGHGTVLYSPAYCPECGAKMDL